MMKLSKAMKQLLKTMMDFDCGVQTYEGVQFDNRARAWFDGEAAKRPTQRFVSHSTVHALARRELVVETNDRWDPALTRHHFVLTDIGRKTAKELQDGSTD